MRKIKVNMNINMKTEDKEQYSQDLERDAEHVEKQHGGLPSFYGCYAQRVQTSEEKRESERAKEDCLATSGTLSQFLF
jgi:hypothetical protein